MSPAVRRLRDEPELFELGIHPNFLPGSSHGSTPEEVLEHCLTLVPDATSLRSHALVQSSPILNRIATRSPITADVSLFLPYAKSLHPVAYRVSGRVLWRLPYFWEDDIEMEQARPCWRLDPLLATSDGLRIFDFHPIHVYMNSFGMGPYRELVSRVTTLQGATEADLYGFVQPGEGTGSLFRQLVAYLSTGSSCLVRDVASQCAVELLGVED